MSEIKYSQLNEEHRIDAEYFGKDILYKLKQLSNLGTIRIGDIADVTDGIHTSIDYDENSRVNLISATSPKENVFDLSRGAFISEKANKLNPRTALRKNDVIISTVGTIGNCAVVDDSILPANSDRHVGIIRIQNDYSPYVLSTFLLSKYGRTQTLREATGNVQLNLFIYKLKELAIPQFSSSFQFSIEQIVKSAHAKLAESKSLYAEAEEILLSELGLKDWQPKNENVSVKRLSDFASSGRLDAEYYQPKFDEIEEKIRKSSHKEISEVVTLKDSYFSPLPKKLYKYIELANIGASGEITGFTEDYGENLPTRARRIVHTGDLLISSIEGSLQSCAIVTGDYDDVLCSTGFYVVTPKLMNAETLLVLLKSDCMQSLLKKGCSGTILTAIAKDEFLKIPLPLLPESIQSLIAEKIQKSFDLRKQSKQLLEQAKRMVEEEIEKQ